MQGKIFAITLLILGIYILGNVLLGDSHSHPNQKDSQVFHIGCYDIDRPLTNSKQIETYLSQLTYRFNQTSTAKITALNRKISQSVYAESGGNELARAFQRYIASYQNIKSRNQYQQSLQSAIKQTKDQFALCRQKFNEKPWDCRNLSSQFNQTSGQFGKLKQKLQGLMVNRAEHLVQSESLLRDEDVTKDAEYIQKYTKEIEMYNSMISKKHHRIKQNNQTLINIDNQIFQAQNTLNQTKQLLLDCAKNKNQIDFCKNISEYVTSLYDDVNLKEIERSMKQKRMIIDLLKSHLIQSKKLGEDTSKVEYELAQTKRDLQLEENLYHQTNNTGKCGLELQFKCSSDSILQLQTNVTLLLAEIQNLANQQGNLTESLKKDIYEKDHFQNKINLLNEQLKNSAVDINHLKLKEEGKKKKLQEYRNNLTNIIIGIGDTNKEILDVKDRRREEIKKIDQLMERGHELMQCLSKKELYLKLEAQKPETTDEDQRLKQETGKSLLGTLKKLLRK